MMTHAAVRVDRSRDLSAALHRLRWNPHVLGALAYPMEAHPADAGWGVPPLDSGHHLRWSVDPRRGAPGGGFYIYHRSHKQYGSTPTHRVDFGQLPAQGTRKSWLLDVGEPARLRMRHAAGFNVYPNTGIAIPSALSPLEITLPTSCRSVAVVLTNVPAGAEVRMTHAGRLVHYARATRFEPDWVPVCLDPADQVHIAAPGATVLGLSWMRVPGDLAGWSPLATFPPLGTAPLDRAGIAARLGNVDLSDVERDQHLTRVLDSIRTGPTAAPLSWPAAAGTSAIDLEAGMLLSALTLQPRLAWAFGRYLVDPQPASIPADYLVVGAWMKGPVAPSPASSASSPGPAGPGSAPMAVAAPQAGLPFVAGAPPLDDLIDALARGQGLFYFAPCYAVAAGRAWEPPFARLDSLEAVSAEARRQLDAQGRALLDLPLRATWSLHQTSGLPLLAAQQSPLAEISLSGPGADPGTRVVTSPSTDSGARSMVDVVAPRLDQLPGSVQLTLTPLDLFGHLIGPTASRALPLPADLYPTAPPPIGAAPEVVPPAGAGNPDLRVGWLWGGRLRLFHPGVRSFIVEWLADSDLPAGVPAQQALRDGSALAWKTLPRVATTGPRTAQVDALDSAFAGQTSRAMLLREGTTLLAGIRTDLRVASGATGRFDGWTVSLGAQSWPVQRHTLGDDAWLFVNLPGGAAGTPFAGLPEDSEQPLATAWTLTPPGQDPVGAVIARVSAAATDLQTLVPGSLVTQRPLVFGVLARLSGPPAQILLDVNPGPQEPGAPPPGRPVPAVGAVEFDPPFSTVLPDVAIASPTPDHARREVWVRVRTVDFLDRPGVPGTPAGAAWAKAFPPVPAAGPAVVRRSPPDAFGRCKLLVRFDRTLAEHGCVLYRASDTQLAVVFERAKRRVQGRGSAALPVFAPLPAGFAWPAGGPQRPEDVTDPLVDFAAAPDMMRVFYNELRVDEGGSGGARPVFVDAFERRGRMTRPGQPAQLFASANDAPLELDDVVDRAGNQYLYLVRPIDRADQEGPVSGVSLPGQGWNISAPAAPELLPVLLTWDEMIVRWRPLRDARVTRYRVTRTPLWQGGPASTVLENSPAGFPSPIRLEGDRIALPEFVLSPAVTDVTSVKTVADGAEHVTDGFVVPVEQQFVWWSAAGNRALLRATPTAGGNIRDRVPAGYAHGVAGGSSVNPSPLTLYRGVLDGEPLALPAGAFASLLTDDGQGNLTDRTAVGTWYDTAFLTSPAALEEGESVVLEVAAADGTRRTFGRCPAATSQPLIAVTGGVIPLTAVAARLAAGDRPSGVFRASAVTRATSGSPDPRGAGAADLIEATSWYTSGFIRSLRSGVPMVLRWRRASDGRERFLATAPGGRPLRFLDGSLVVDAWDPARETLDGVFERATVAVFGTVVTVPASAQNMAAHVSADAVTGRIVTLLPHGAPVRVRQQNGAELSAHFEQLQWRGGRLMVAGLFEDGAFDPDALYTFEPDAMGQLVPRTSRDRLGVAGLSADRSELIAQGVPPEGARIELEYDGDGTARTIDPSRLEWSVSTTEADVGRRFEIRVEALCDFPNPVGTVSSRPAVTEVEVAPPLTLHVTITSAQWTASKALEVRYAGPAGLTYRVAAMSQATGQRYVLADPAAGGVVSTAVATDGTPLPLTESLLIELRGSYPNAAQAYIAPLAEVDALVPADAR